MKTLAAIVGAGLLPLLLLLGSGATVDAAPGTPTPRPKVTRTPRPKPSPTPTRTPQPFQGYTIHSVPVLPLAPAPVPHCNGCKGGDNEPEVVIIIIEKWW